MNRYHAAAAATGAFLGAAAPWDKVTWFLPVFFFLSFLPVVVNSENSFRSGAVTIAAYQTAAWAAASAWTLTTVTPLVNPATILAAIFFAVQIISLITTTGAVAARPAADPPPLPSRRS